MCDELATSHSVTSITSAPAGSAAGAAGRGRAARDGSAVMPSSGPREPRRRARLAEQTRTEERARIARELHDVIAHSLTVSLLHVTSARLAVEHDPAAASRALAEAERLGRRALTEVRATVGLLRVDDRGEVAPPVPGGEQVPMLVEQFRRAGVPVCPAIEGDLSALPETVGSTLYRIVQEALTNAVKHAPGARVTVEVAATNGHVDVRVDSAGIPRHGTGMGLTNMAERARALGGTCTAGPGGRAGSSQRSSPGGRSEARTNDSRATHRRPGARAGRAARDPARALRLPDRRGVRRR